MIRSMTSLPIRILYVDADENATRMFTTLARLTAGVEADIVPCTQTASQALARGATYDFVIVSLGADNLRRPDLLRLISDSACLNGTALILLTQGELRAGQAITTNAAADTFMRKPSTRHGLRGLLDLIVPSVTTQPAPARGTPVQIVGTGQWNAPIELLAA